MRFHNLRTLRDGEPGPEASVNKLFWSNWHRELGNLAMDVQGMGATIDDAPLRGAYENAAHWRDHYHRSIAGERASRAA